jgi:putative oxidoreductase
VANVSLQSPRSLGCGQQNTNDDLEDLVSIFESSRSPWTERMLSVLRIVVGILYFEHGTQKVFDLPPLGTPHTYHLASQQGLAGVLETVGGLAILFGLLTRPVAFILAGEMAVAYFQVHIRRSVFPIDNRGDNVVLFCFVYLYLVFRGAGPWSIDALIARSKRGRLPGTLTG